MIITNSRDLRVAAIKRFGLLDDRSRRRSLQITIAVRDDPELDFRTSRGGFRTERFSRFHSGERTRDVPPHRVSHAQTIVQHTSVFCSVGHYKKKKKHSMSKDRKRPREITAAGGIRRSDARPPNGNVHVCLFSDDFRFDHFFRGRPSAFALPTI